MTTVALPIMGRLQLNLYPPLRFGRQGGFEKMF